MLPSIQQLWEREAPVDGRTTTFNESVCQVAHNGLEVGSFHTPLFGVVYVTCGDFHDGSKKGTASVHKILCQSWEKCYEDPQVDSTSLQGPNLELCTGVSMTCPIQDRFAHQLKVTNTRETQKLNNY